MKLRIASLAALCLALAAVPALADINETFDNGPINGTKNAWTISFNAKPCAVGCAPIGNGGFVVSDSFLVTDNSTVTGFSFGAWEFFGDSLSSLTWSITQAENAGDVYGKGVAKGGKGGNLTDQILSTNTYGYDVDLINVFGLNVSLPFKQTYWLNLSLANSVKGLSVYWDENSGVGCGGLNGTKEGCPSLASQSAIGSIPSEAFTINFTEPGGTTPEPSSIMLFGSGILGMAGILRRKLV